MPAWIGCAGSSAFAAFTGMRRSEGAGIDEVADLLGHKDLRMAKRYQHLSPGHLVAAVGRLDSIFGGPKQLAEG